MSDFVTVARVGEIPDGEGRVFVVGDYLIAVFHENGEYSAINDLCPHMGASLSASAVDGGIVTCHWHAWRFRVTDGTWCDNPRIKTDSFETRILNNEIQVAASPRPRDDAPPSSPRPTG